MKLTKDFIFEIKISEDRWSRIRTKLIKIQKWMIQHNMKCSWLQFGIRYTTTRIDE